MAEDAPRSTATGTGPGPGDDRLSRILFCTALLLPLSFAGWLTLERRVPRGHDAFQYFAMQYYFLNDRIAGGEVARWMPFMTQGTVSTWWYTIQAAPLQNFLLLTGWVPSGANFLPIFHLGMLVNELFFLTGMWLLAGRYVQAPLARLFVLLTACGSVLWVDQPWWNFGLYAWLPLVLHLLHRFVDSGRLAYLLLGTNLLAFQNLGNLPYFPPVQTLLVFLYSLGHFAAHPAQMRSLLNDMRKWHVVLACGLCLVLSFACIYYAQRLATGEIVSYNLGRNPDGTVPLSIYLSYGGRVGWAQWNELALGTSVNLDSALYVGVACLPLVLLGMAAGRQTLALTVPMVCVVLLSAGTPLATLVYYCWPFMKYFRHLGLIAPAAKMFLILLAGCGFETLFLSGKVSGRAKLLTALGLVILAGLSLYLSYDLRQALRVVGKGASASSPDLIFLELLREKDFRSALLGIAAAAAVAAAAVALVPAGLSNAGPRRQRAIVAAVLFCTVQALDMNWYRFSLLARKTFALDESAAQTLYFAPLPFPARRLQPPDHVMDAPNVHAALELQRQWALQEVLPKFPRAATVGNLRAVYGADYWTLDSYLGLDAVGSIFRVDHWLAPLDESMRAYWGQPLTREAPVTGFSAAVGLLFPLRRPAAAKVTGCTEDKLQFFTRADVLDSKETVARLIAHRDYSGDLLFLTPPPGPDAVSLSSTAPTPPVALKASTRVRPAYQVTRFTPNILEVEVDNDTGGPIWMMYCDVWHSGWVAWVNGERQPVYIADLAYKAVQLPPGRTSVRFEFSPPGMALLFSVLEVGSTLWLLVGLYLGGRCAFGERAYSSRCWSGWLLQRWQRPLKRGQA